MEPTIDNDFILQDDGLCCLYCGVIYSLERQEELLQHIKDNHAEGNQDKESGQLIELPATCSEIPLPTLSFPASSPPTPFPSLRDTLSGTDLEEHYEAISNAGLNENEFFQLMRLDEPTFQNKIFDILIESNARIGPAISKELRNLLAEARQTLEENLFDMIPESVPLPEKATIFRISGSKKFTLADLTMNDIQHNLGEDAKDVTTVDVHDLPQFVQDLHNEMHKKRHISPTLRTSDDVYRQMFISIKNDLGQEFRRFFEGSPLGPGGASRTVNEEEVVVYYDLLRNFEKILKRIKGKSELCKCAALHSIIIDRAVQRGRGAYDRNMSWTSQRGNISVFETPEGAGRYDPMFDCHLYWSSASHLEYPVLLLEEKPNSEHSGCADDRLQLAIMSKVACSCMTLDIGADAVVLAVFVNGTTYEMYYGFFGGQDNSEFFFRCVSKVEIRTNIEAFKHAFMFHNFALRPKPSSKYSSIQLAANQTVWMNTARKRQRDYDTLRSFKKDSENNRGSKKSKSKRSSNKSNVTQQHVEALHCRGYVVDMPVDYDAVNVIVPFNWSPNVVRGVCVRDKLPIVAKLATDSEVDIIQSLRKSAGQYIVEPLDIVQTGSQQILVMRSYQTADEIEAPNTAWLWTFTFALLQAVFKLHQENITHNDIKPEHIALDGKDNVEHLRLLDFDIARKHSSQDVQVQGIIGTKGWMAPEVEHNQDFYNPFKADIWSVGAVLERIGKNVLSEKMNDFIRWLKTTNPKERPTAAKAIDACYKDD